MSGKAARRHKAVKNGALLLHSSSSTEAERPPPGDANRFALTWTRRQQATASAHSPCVPKPPSPLQSIPEESASQLDPAAPVYSPLETDMPVTTLLTEATGRWPESSSKHSFGSLAARDYRTGKMLRRPPQHFKSFKGNGNGMYLSTL